MLTHRGGGVTTSLLLMHILRKSIRGVSLHTRRRRREENDVRIEPDRVDSAGRPWTLVYDGDCDVCGRFVRLLERWDRRQEIEVVPSQNAGVPARFPWIPAAAYADAIQLIGPGGHTTQGAEAIEELLGIVPKGWMLGWIFRLPFVGWVADKLYRWFARNRYRFGCGKHCQLRQSGQARTATPRSP
jgi:predicted DCC family thiol-disulfide oxidoreductase YuxK